MTADLQTLIETAYEQRSQLSPKTVSPEIQRAILEVIFRLDQGELRVAEKQKGHWVVHEWIKKAVLLFFCTHANQVLEGGYTGYFIKCR